MLIRIMTKDLVSLQRRKILYHMWHIILSSANKRYAQNRGSAILHRRPDSHHALLKATWCLGPRGGVLFEMYIAFLHNGLAPSPFPISVAHLSWVGLSWLHLYSIFTTFIDMNNRTARLLNLHVPRSLTLCINGVYIIENAGVYPHTRWPDNRRLRSHVTDSLIPKVYTQTWLKNCWGLSHAWHNTNSKHTPISHSPFVYFGN